MAAGLAALGLVDPAVAALPGLPRDVGGLGGDERRGDQHHPGAVVPATPRPRRQHRVQRGHAGRRGRRARAHPAHRRGRASPARSASRPSSRSWCCSPSPARSCGGVRPSSGSGPTAMPVPGAPRPRRLRTGARARRRAAHVALLERVRAVRARPCGPGRCAHASGRARDAGARSGRRRPRRERDDGGGGDRAAGDGFRRRSREPAAGRERTLVVQIAGLTLLAWAPSAVRVYAGCALFGLGVGNLTTLPGLILAVEWPRERFSALVGLVVGINQFTFAFGPSLVASCAIGPAPTGRRLAPARRCKRLRLP